MEPVNKLQTSVVKPLFDYLKKQKENQRFARTVEITATFSLISFFLIFAVKPAATIISSLVGDIKSKQILTKELKSKIEDLIKAQDAFSTVQERYQVVDSSLPDKASFFNAYEQVSQTAAAYGIVLDRLSFNLENPKSVIDPNVSQLSLGLNNQSGFDNSLKFIVDLLNNQRLMDVENISFNNSANIGTIDPTSSSAVSEIKTINSRFITNIYYWNEKNDKK